VIVIMTRNSSKRGADLSCWNENQDYGALDVEDEEFLKGFVDLEPPPTIEVNKTHVIYSLILFMSLNRT
jgi:hypothetical protein